MVVTPILPQSHPVREGDRAASTGDIRWALTRAAKYLRDGGDREAVTGYVDEWLDYWLDLELERLINGAVGK